MNFGFLWRRAQPYLPELAIISGLAVVSSLATLAIPWLAGQFLAGVIGADAIDTRDILALLIAALVCLAGINILVAILSEVASGRILAGLQREVYARIQAMPLSFHDSNKSGELLSLMTYEVGNLSTFLTSTLANVPSMLLTAGGATVLLFLIDPSMALVIPVLVPLFYIAMKLVGRRLRLLSRRVRRAEVELFSTAESDLEMLAAIKAFATEGHQQARYDAIVERARTINVAQKRITAFINPLVSLLAALAAISILLIGSAQVAGGARSPGELFAFLLYAALLTRPIGGLADTYGAFQMARGTLARLEAIFAKPVEDGYAQTARLERAAGAIAFENVSFGYAGRGQVIDNMSLTIAPGEIVALTGQNGIGKSTLVRLLLRFYDPDAGCITLDGVDTATIQVQDLRRQFGYVPQRALLFNGTIADNIAFGEQEPDPARVERAARMAQAWDFIEHLPRGLATVIGDHGIRVSGGQGQRIALARALYRDPPIYIFDEATSMFDLDGEAAFVETCVQSLEGRTVIIITHRPASLALADRIIVASESGWTETDPPGKP